MNVLISAYACEPEKGSEPGVGWNWVKQISRFYKVFVITRSNNKIKIEKVLFNDKNRNIKFFYFDLPKLFIFWKKGERGMYLYYILWQLFIFFKAWSLKRKYNINLYHNLTFGNVLLPNFIFIIFKYYIWGPLGGGERVPKEFRKNIKHLDNIKEIFRDLILYLLKFNILFILNCNKANIIIVRTEDTARIIPLKYRNKVKLLLETGVNKISLYDYKKDIMHKNEDNILIISAGRLIHWKGFEFGIKAFYNAQKKFQNIYYYIVGNGSDLKRLKKITKELGIANKVSFLGMLPRSEVIEKMRKSDIFLYPSFKDAGAWVVFEAMQEGLPVITIDKGGMSEIINDECGIKIYPYSTKQVIDDLTKAIIKLSKSYELRTGMGARGKKRVEDVYLWSKKGEIIKDIYENILNT